MAKSIHSVPFQALIEDFIATAESMGHRGIAKLSSSHPAIKVRQWRQIRSDYGTLARYNDELGNVVELRHSGSSTRVVQFDPRREWFGRLLGTRTGYAFKANSKAEALTILAAKEVVTIDSSYLIVSLTPALGISYNHN